MTTGIHHVTALTRNVQNNVDFYTGFLGLRLVKQTGGYEDAEQLHLFYGDALGAPGSIVSFLVWQDGAAGRVGHGQVGEIAFAIPPESMGDWLTRAMHAGIAIDGPRHEMGETTLRLKDPDGITVKLVGVDRPATAPLPDPIAPRRIHSVTILTEDQDETGRFIAQFGYRPIKTEGAITRFASDSDVIDVRDAKGFFAGIPGTGVFDHVAFRAPDVAAVRDMRRNLRHNSDVTHVHDRKYFLSLYARDTAGILYEYATDAPGFTIDEPAAELGTHLLFPPEAEARAADLAIMLPQFVRPGQPRCRLRDLHFTHRFYWPDLNGQATDENGGSDDTIILLHGSGGTEADLMPLAHAVNPKAALLGVRGRSTEEGQARWFRRFGPDQFDQNDIHAEAAAFAAFVDEAVQGYHLKRDNLTFMGYSNGANFLAAVARLYPDTVGRMVLLRPVDVLDDAPTQSPPTGQSALILTGKDDPRAPDAAALAESLRRAGVDVVQQQIDAGHALSEHDAPAVRAFLGR